MDLSEAQTFSFISSFPNVSSKAWPHNDNFEILFTDVFSTLWGGGGALYVNYCSGRWLSCRGCWSDTQFLTALEGRDFPALLEPSPQQLSSLPWGNTGNFGPISAMFFSVHFPVWNLTFTELKVPLGREFHHLCGAGVGEGTKLCVVSQIFFLQAVLRISLFKLTRF